MSHSVRRHIGIDIEEYDRSIRRYIRGYEAMLEAAADAVAGEDPSHVLDLGAGTGALAELVLHRTDRTTVELLDVDPEMMVLARERLPAFGERVRFTLASYDDPLPASDAVCASLSLHHIRDPERKRELYARIHDALPDGGVLVNADLMVPGPGPERDGEYERWIRHNEGQGIPEDEFWANHDMWASEDRYFPVEEELRLLGEVGFRGMCLWRDAPSTVLLARKGA